MIGKVTKRAWLRGLMKREAKDEGGVRMARKILRNMGKKATLYNVTCLQMGWMAGIR